MTPSQLSIYFMIGLTAGGLSCMALQGGLITSLFTRDKNLSQQNKVLALLSFLVARLGAYILAGFMLGALGGVLQLQDWAVLTFQVVASLFMIATACNLLNVHPIFRYVALQPPRQVKRWLKKVTGTSEWFTPALLGVFTVLLPCGVTQAMELLAISSASSTDGALILAAFIAGTTPILAVYGLVASVLEEKYEFYFRRAAAAALIIIGLYGLNATLVAIDSPVTAQKIIQQFKQEEATIAMSVENIQQVTINVTNYGYSPARIQVKKNLPVRLTLKSNETYSCAVAFRLPAFNISTFMEPTAVETYSFTPTKAGKYTFSCSMGMYQGVLEVI